MFDKIKEALLKFLSGREGGIDKFQVILLTQEDERLGKIAEILEAEANAVLESKPNLSAQLNQLAEAIRAGDEQIVTDGFQKIMGPEPKPAAKPQVSPTAFEPQTDTELAKKVAELEKKTLEAEAKVSIAEANAVVDKSNLPEPAKEAVKEAVAREVMSKRETDATSLARAELEKKRKELKALGLGGGKVELPTSSRMSFGLSGDEEKILALRGFFMGEPQKDTEGRKVQPLHSLNQAARIFCDLNTYEDAGHLQRFMELCVSKPYRGGPNNREYRSRWDSKGRATFDITIANWPDILGDEMTRAMLKGWEMPNLQQWRLLVRTPTSVNDFRTQRRLRWGGWGIWSTVSEGNPYQDFVAANKPSQEEATFSIAKYGGLTGTITIEAMANDDMNQISRIPMTMGISGANTLNQTVLNGVFSATNTLSYTSGGTGNYIYCTDHASGSNKGTSALSPITLSAARQAMLAQTKYDETVITLMIQPKILWVPIELEEMAFRITQSNLVQVATASGQYPTGSLLPTANIGNLHQGLGYQVVGYWTDADNWYLSADPALADFVEIAFWRGIQEPEIFWEAANTGFNFSSDVLVAKGRLVFGWGVNDHRGLYAGIL